MRLGFTAAAAALLALAAPALAEEATPPPSLKFPGLTQKEQEAVRSQGPWRTLGEEEIRETLRGKTLHYLLLGRPRGEEHHFEDGRAIWKLEDGSCLSGVWVAKNETLCYFYGFGRSGCWTMVEGPQGYRHRPSDGAPPDVVVRRVSEEPVSCASPPVS